MGKDYKQDDNFDAIIHQKMTNLEGVPAFDAWDKITSELDKDKSPNHQIWWGAGSVLLLLLVGTVVFWKKDFVFADTEQYLTSSYTNKNQTSKILSQRIKNNFEIPTKENLIQKVNLISVKENLKKGNSNRDLNANSIKTEIQLSNSNSEKRPKNNVNSNKTTLIPNKKGNSSNSIKNINSLLLGKNDLKEANKIENIAIAKIENKEEKVLEIKKIKRLKIALINLKNDLQLLDYQSFITKSKAKEIEIKNATRLTFAFTTLQSYKQLIPNLNDSIIVSAFEDTETLKTKTSFALTLGMERQLNERWEAEWGINYTRIEQNMNFLYAKKTAPVTILFDTNQNGFDTRPMRKQEKFAHKYAFNYLGVYAGASYRIFRYARPEQRVGARFTLATLVNRDKSLNTLQENFTAFYKVSYQLSPYWRFNISPEFNYYFRSTYKKDALLGAKPYTLGLQLGLNRRFGAKK